jgi:hypothetical protein
MRALTGVTLAATSSMQTLKVLALVAAGCQTGGEVLDRETGEQLREIRDHMHARYSATSQVRTAIAYGDLERAKQAAQTIALLDEPGALPEWKPYVENVRAAAGELSRSSNLVAAAKQLALLGWRCAQCHQAVPGISAKFPATPAQNRDQRLSAAMTNHQWATGRMWEGLIGPSDQRWNEGAAALAQAPLTITAEGDVPGHELGIADDVSRIRLLATRAQKLQVAFDRAEVYGQLLATCARCHHTIRDR